MEQRNESLAGLFAEECQKRGDRIAVHALERLTFAQLYEGATRIALQLQQRGIRSGSVVALSTPPSDEAAVAFFGILLAGCKALPIDPIWKKGFAESICQKAQPKVILTGSSTSHCYFEECGATISIEKFLEEPLGGALELPSVCAKEAAAVFFTPENPLGVPLSHFALLNLLHWHKTQHHFSPSDTGGSVSRMGSGAFFIELITYLLSGVAIKFAKETLHSNPRALIQWLEEEKITLCRLPTLIGEKTLEEHWPATLELRTLFLYGGQLKKKPKKMHPFSLIFTFGELETGLISTEYLVQHSEVSRIIPIGKPIAHTKTVLLDESLQEVPQGEVGELAIGGPIIAQGYFQGDAEANEKFVIYTCFGKRATPLFLTGALARQKEDGNLEFLGNASNGECPLEPTTVESVLGSHPSVYQCLCKVVSLEDQKNLVAWWVKKKGNSITKKELRKYLRQKLPSHLIPHSLIELAELPIKADGTICTEQLPLPTPKEECDDEPQTPIEMEVERIWVHFFGERGGNFFDLATNGNKGRELLAIIKKHFGKAPTEDAFYLNPTVKGLSTLLQGKECPLLNSSLIQASYHTDHPPLIFIAEEGTDHFALFELAHLLREKYTVYGYFFSESIEKERDLLLQRFRDTALLGLGNGGLLAYELAVHGANAPFVGLIETYAPTTSEYFSLFKRLFATGLLFYRMGKKEKKEFLIEQIEGWEQKLSYSFKQSWKRSKIFHYEPEKTKKEITIFTQLTNGKKDLSLGWKQYAPKLILKKLEGSAWIREVARHLS